MSTPADDRSAPRTESTPAPTVSTAPANDAGPRWWSAIPHHLGRARTSTVALAVLFVATFALYLQVKPADPAATTSGAGTGQQEQPATTSTPSLPTTAPQTSTEPPPSEDEPTTTTAPTTTAPTTTAPTTTPAPDRTGQPAPTTGAEPTGEAGTTAPTTP